MKESKYALDSRIVFRETFSSEQETRQLGGVPTAVTYSNGIGKFNGINSRINYNISLNGIYSVRFKLNSFSADVQDYLFDFRNQDALGIGYIRFESSITTLLITSGTAYINGITTTTVSSATKEIIVSGISISSIFSSIGARASAALNYITADIELVEIYKGALTPQEVSNLYNNRAYTPLQLRSGLTEILNIDNRRGTISNKYNKNTTNEVITNVIDREFTNDTGYWGKSNSTISNGEAQGNASIANINKASILTVGKQYIVYVEVSSFVGGMGLSSATAVDSLNWITKIGVNSTTFTAVNVGFIFILRNGGAITSISIKEIIPNVIPTDVSVVRQGSIYGMNFNGSNSKIDCGSYDSLVGDKTFIAWIKPRSLGTIGRIFDNGKLIFSVIGPLTIQLLSDGATAIYAASSIIKFEVNILCAATRTSTGITNFYINGVLSGTTNQSSGTPVAGNINLNVGNRTTNDRGFNGIISKPRIINGILTAEEISQLWTSEKSQYGL